MKRRTFPAPKSGLSPYRKHRKTPYHYPFPTGKAYAEHRMKQMMEAASHASKDTSEDINPLGTARARSRMEREVERHRRTTGRSERGKEARDAGVIAMASIE